MNTKLVSSALLLLAASFPLVSSAADCAMPLGTPGVTLNGTPGNDEVFLNSGTIGSSTVNNDAISGFGGDDTLFANNGDDCLNGGFGNDVLGGGEGNDTVIGGPGDDTLFGGPGDDVLSGDGGNDEIFTGPGNDSVFLSPIGGGTIKDDGGDDHYVLVAYEGRSKDNPSHYTINDVSGVNTIELGKLNLNATRATLTGSTLEIYSGSDKYPMLTITNYHPEHIQFDQAAFQATLQKLNADSDK